MIFSEIETLPINKLRKLQNERLVNTLNRVSKSVPFYKRIFEENNINPDSIRSVNDIHRLPFTTKEDLRQNYPFGLFAVPQSEIIRIHASSGTTGKPTVVGYTRNDIKTFAEVNARSLAAAGALPGMKLHNAYGYGLFTGGLGLHYGGELLGMSVVPVSGGMTERQLLLLQDFKSEVICCTPSYAQTLAEIIVERGLKEKIGLKYAVLGAEPWTETIRNEIEKTLDIKATNIYGLSEIIGPGVSQEDVDERGSGSTIWEDHFFPEIIHLESGESLPYGEEGILVFTTITKEGMPVLRYKTNDITSIYYDSNSKRTHIKMGPIKGRADGMLIIRGVNFFHTQVEELIDEIEEMSPNYLVIVSKDKNMDQVEIKVELEKRYYDSDSDLEDLKKLLIGKLKQKIKDTIGLSMDISIAEYGRIPRSEGGKLSRVVDNRNK